MSMNEAELTLAEVLQTISGHISICTYGCKAVLISERGEIDPMDGTLTCPLCGSLLYDYADFVRGRAAEFHI